MGRQSYFSSLACEIMRDLCFNGEAKDKVYHRGLRKASLPFNEQR